MSRYVDTCTVTETESAKEANLIGTGFGRIDYIFIRENEFKVLDAGIASIDKFRDASDHIAYYTKLELNL